MATFGTRLRELRRDSGIGQVELSNKIGVSKGIISLWENDLREPTMSNLVALANHFDVSLDYLAGRKEEY